MNTSSLAGHDVARLGFGAMQLPGPGVMGPPRDHDQAVAVLRQAVDAGVNHIDTAEFYGPTVANQLIREALHPYPDDLVLVTKVGALRDADGAFVPAQHPAELRAAVEDNLRTLGIERIAVVNLRLMDPAEHPGSPSVDLDDQLAELTALRDEGKLEGIGLSGASVEQVRRALPVGLACVQNAYNLRARDDEPVLDLCAREGIAYVPFFPLGSAFPGMPKIVDDPAVRDVAQRLGATPAQVGLAWLLQHRENILLIPGTSSPQHLAENLATTDVVLSGRDVAALG